MQFKFFKGLNLVQMEATKDAMKKRMLQIPIIKKQKLSKNEQIKSTVLNRLVFDVLEVVKGNHIPWTRSELIRKLAWDVFENPDLLQALEKNQRIDYNKENQTLTYSPLYKISNSQDLKHVLKGQLGVMEIKSLSDSWPEIDQHLESMQNQKEIILLSVKDEPRFIYLDQPDLYINMSEEYIDYWNQVIIPDSDIMIKELNKAGLQESQIATQGDLKPKTLGVKRKKFNKRTRITNTHLEGYDVRQESI